MHSLLHFAMFFENIPYAFALLTPEMEIIAANNAFLDTTLSRGKDIIGTTQFSGYPDTVNNRNGSGNFEVRRAFNQLLTTHEPQTIAVASLGLSVDTKPVADTDCWIATYTPAFNKDRSEIQFILLHVLGPSLVPGLSLETDFDVDAAPWNLAKLFEEVPGFVAYLKGSDHTVVFANAACQKLATSGKIIGKSVQDALPEFRAEGIVDSLDEFYLSGKHWSSQRYSIVFERNSETEVGLVTTYIDFTFQPVYANDGGVSGIFVQGNDVTNLKLALQRSEAERERMLYLSQHDALTGLPNRTAFHEELARSVRMAEANRSLLHVLFVDVDRLKEINDSFGHDVGDKLLNAIAKRLKSCTDPHEDFVGRLSGDEFGVISRKQSEAAHLAWRFVKEIAEPISFDDQEVKTSVSVGVTTYPKDGLLPTKLLRNADLAMYHAKQSGRSKFEVYTEILDAAANRRQAIKHGLLEALRLNKLSLYYQPIFSNDSGLLCGVEALLRWHTDDIPFLNPSELIPIAEESENTMVVLGAWILRTACEQAQSWWNRFGYRLRVSVNISPRQFHHAEFLDLIDTILLEVGLPPKYLQLEISERTLIENSVQNISLLESLRKKGVSISVDDFGTVFSSLIYLKNFPVDIVKLDKKFLTGLPHVRENAVITSALISLAKGLDVAVGAEGIENEEQFAFLQRTGCDQFQGFLFSYPVTEENLMQKIKKGDWFLGSV